MATWDELNKKAKGGNPEPVKIKNPNQPTSKSGWAALNEQAKVNLNPPKPAASTPPKSDVVIPSQGKLEQSKVAITNPYNNTRYDQQPASKLPMSQANNAPKTSWQDTFKNIISDIGSIINPPKKDLATEYNKTRLSVLAPKPMVFKVGEGLNDSQAVQAKKVISDNINKAIQDKSTNLNYGLGTEIKNAPNNLKKEMGSDILGSLDFIWRAGLQVVSGVGALTSAAIVSNTKRLNDPSLKDISYDDIWKQEIDSFSNRALDIGSPLEYFTAKATNRKVKENNLFMDEVNKLALSSNEKMKNGDTFGSMVDAGKIAYYGFVRDWANPFYLFEIKGFSEGSFKLSNEKTLFKMEINPAKSDFLLGDKVKATPKTVVFDIKADQPTIIDVKGNKVSVQDKPNIKMYVEQKSNGVREITVTNSGGEIFNKKNIKTVAEGGKVEPSASIPGKELLPTSIKQNINPTATGESTKVLLNNATAEVQKIVEETGTVSQDSLAKLEVSKQQFDTYVESNKHDVISFEGTPSDSGEAPKANLSVVQFENGKWSVSYDISYGEGNLIQPFDTSGEFNSSGAAVVNATGKVLNWLKEQDPKTQGAHDELASIAQQLTDYVAGKTPIDLKVNPSLETAKNFNTAEEWIGSLRTDDPLVNNSYKDLVSIWKENKGNKITDPKWLKENSTQENFNLAKESFQAGDVVIPINNLVEEMDGVLFEPTPIKSITEFDNFSPSSEFLVVSQYKINDLPSKTKTLTPEIQKEVDSLLTGNEGGDIDVEDIVQFHGTQDIDNLKSAIKNGTIKPSNGLIGKGFYVTGEKPLAEYFGKQLKNGDHRIGTNNKVDVVAIDLRDLNIKTQDFGKQEYFDFLDSNKLSQDSYNAQLKKEGYDGLNLKGRGETVIWNVDKIKEYTSPTQKEKVQTSVAEKPKTVKEVAKETGILEPNVRRILGVGAKEGTFERVDKGVYVLKKDGQEIAYIHPGDAVDILPQLAKDGFKADMIFLDIPYKTPAVSGGNRGAKFEFITTEQFKIVVDSVKQIAKTDNTPVFYMYSQAKSGLAAMEKYNQEMIDAGFKAVARGEYTKLQKDGVSLTRNMRGNPDYPEAIILFTKSGNFDKAQPDLNFKMIRPKGYQTEKPAEMLNKIITMSTNEGDVVLDPFAGSGVTGEQAIKEGRKAVLIEKNQKAIDDHIKPRLEKALEVVDPRVKIITGKINKIISGIEGDTFTADRLSMIKNGLTKMTPGDLIINLRDVIKTIDSDRFTVENISDLISYLNTKPKVSRFTKTTGAKKKYQIIHEWGVKETVEGEPVKIIDGVDTFIHEGKGGWVVSEATTGRFISESRTKDGAIAKASFNIDEVGKKRFIELINEKKMPTSVKPRFAKPKLANEKTWVNSLKKKYGDTILLYHNTNQESIDSIIKNGFKANSGKYGEDIFFSLGTKTDRVGGKANITIEVPSDYYGLIYPDEQTYREILTDKQLDLEGDDQIAIMRADILSNPKGADVVISAENIKKEWIKSAKTNIEKPTVESKIEYVTDYDMNDLKNEQTKKAIQQAEVIAELENARPGKRMGIGYGIDKEQISWKSTFPGWIPSELRDSNTVRAVLENIKNNTLPVKAKEIRLYNVVAEEMSVYQEAQREVEKIIDVDAIDFSKADLGGMDKINKEISVIDTELNNIYEQNSNQETTSTPANEKNINQVEVKTYHITEPENVASIKAGGLNPTRNGIYGNVGFSATSEALSREHIPSGQALEMKVKLSNPLILDGNKTPIELLKETNYKTFEEWARETNHDGIIIQNADGKGNDVVLTLKPESTTNIMDVKTQPRFAKPRETGGDYNIVRKIPKTDVPKQPAITPEELAKRINQVNKVGQKNAILRRMGKVQNPKAAGVFVSGQKSSIFKKSRGVAPEGEIRLKESYVADSDLYYLSVLSHETGHAIDAALNGGKTNVNPLKVFGDSLSTELQNTLYRELKDVTIDLVGIEEYRTKPGYYGKKTELLARFFEKMFMSPSNLAEIAPTAVEMIERNQIKHPIIAEMLEAAAGAIDKGQLKYVPLRDLREIYHKYLGRTVGDVAYDAEMAHRAMVERGKVVIEKFIKTRFKGLKDSPELLFRAAEAIKITVDGKPIFGTRDFAIAKNPDNAEELIDSGFYKVYDDRGIQVMKEVDGEKKPLFARERYSEEEAKALYEQLSPKGKELINDFTAARSEAKDYFNREVIKEVNKIDGNIEGWVHHYIPQKPLGTSGKRLRFRQAVAGSRQQRTGAEGYIEDLQLSLTKALTDLETEKQFNEFIRKQFATVTKPLIKGTKPDPGWVEVQGDIFKGVGTPQEKKMVIIKTENGKTETILPRRNSYQMPKAIYERYKLYGGLAEEASTATRIINDINRGWRINVLTHVGSAATNMISGGLQYGSKILTDFYSELLTGQVKMAQTRRNVTALVQALLPKGWSESPDWIYGGDRSNFYGQFTDKPGISGQAVDAYADKALKLYGAVERYWKKVITISEKGRTLKGLESMTVEGLRAPNQMEKDLIAQVNREVDLFAYDYDNVPLWLEAHSKSAVGQMIKPFLKYPYKYAKHILNMSYAVFDRSLPWQERAAKLLALTTMITLYSIYKKEKNKKRETPAGDENTPPRMSPRGRLFVGKDKAGNEMFIRTAKYPFFNISDIGEAVIKKDFEGAKNVIADMLGGLHPVSEIGLTLFTNYENEYDRYTPIGVKLGNKLSTFVPGFRILQDISNYFDPFQRKQTTFSQTFTKLIPTTNADLQQKLHGDIRTESIPLEGTFEPDKKVKGQTKTTFERELVNYKSDVFLSALTGIYNRRVDPEAAKAVQIRSEKNAKQKTKTDSIEQYAQDFINNGGDKKALQDKLIKDVFGETRPTFKERKSLRDSFDSKVDSLKAEKTNKSSNNNGIKTDTISTENESSFISDIALYAKSIGTDPLTAFNRIFTGQKITKLVNGTIIVERMPLEDSQAIKESQGGKNKDFKLEHIVSLELGGSNSPDNLALVPTDVWEKFTKIDNELGRKLRNGEITKAEAQKQIKEAKKDYIK